MYNSFGDFEDKNYALCRWLRARKYNLYEAIKMVEEATEMRESPRKDQFFPDPEMALGCPRSLYLKQYPQMCIGKSKSGHPVFLSKPGILNVDGLECITSIQGILNYHWFDMYHSSGASLKKSVESSNGEYKRFEFICVVDLAGLTSSQITKRALNIVKIQSKIDSLCFPETLNRMLVINAPSFFTITWKLIRGWIDKRTAGKVELYSSRKLWHKRLLELMPMDELPNDYGGTSLSTEDMMSSCQLAPSIYKIKDNTKLLHVR